MAEFLHALCKDSELPFLWHYLPIYDFEANILEIGSGKGDFLCQYFPDPWPKRCQQKNRLVLRDCFLELICKVLKPGLRYFYWATDHKEYNALALQAFRNFPQAKILEENTAQPTYGIETGKEDL